MRARVAPAPATPCWKIPGGHRGCDAGRRWRDFVSTPSIVNSRGDAVGHAAEHDRAGTKRGLRRIQESAPATTLSARLAIGRLDLGDDAHRLMIFHTMPSRCAA